MYVSILFKCAFLELVCIFCLHLLASVPFRWLERENSASTSVLFGDHILPPPPYVPLDLVLGCLSFLILRLVMLMSSSLWQQERFIWLVAEVPVELQPLSLLFLQQEVVDVREQLARRHRVYEALPVQSQLVQQQHAEVRPGDPER